MICLNYDLKFILKNIRNSIKSIIHIIIKAVEKNKNPKTIDWATVKKLMTNPTINPIIVIILFMIIIIFDFSS